MTFWTRERLEQALEEIPLMDGSELYRLARLMVAELWLHATGERWLTAEETAVRAAALGIVGPPKASASGGALR